MPFSLIFNQKDRCKDNSCSVNRNNIKAVFKPDEGFLDSNLKNRLFPPSYKICDCIIICTNDNIIIVEILCGTLTFKEYKEKVEQLENCYKVIESQGLKNKIKQIVLQYKRLENPKRNPQFRKKLTNPRVRNIKLELLNSQTITLNC